ncbi:nucleoside deaminase [Salipaludibacillus sp. CUR1]|uniref:nucleoside deaminase n=1 Tax=Salipaludibacillus sp. CUR1 TaxID=2820003 RepID=UPI001E2ECB79|nr:nucleoside deaminase [Salipaludibacillus sp. CUR1]MCE7791866.1 nucleoside deaminase [Salipaludibacillus sp. CUR1]
MNEFMKRAVDLAVRNVKEGGAPFGAVMTRNGQIVAESVNENHHVYDVTSHAEIVAIRRLQEKEQTNNLAGTTLYASAEPCPMCLAAMYFAGINNIFYCSSIEEGVQAGLTKPQIIYEDLAKSNEERQIVMKQMALEAGQDNPITLWANQASQPL